MKNLFLTAASLLAMASIDPEIAVAQAQPAIEVPPIEFNERILDNGLRVIAIQDQTSPDVYVSMWYEVGSKHDPDRKSGFAHLFEHVLSSKTVNIPYGAITSMVEDVGGTSNASTWLDRTHYFEYVPAQYLERMLWAHAERMARPVIDEEVFLKEREIVKEELRLRYLAPPYGRTLLALKAGASVDPKSLAGRANMAAGLANQGTASRSAEDISRSLERLGASFNAFATNDGTGLVVSAPTNVLGEAVGILQDIVRNASYPDEEFAREKKRALDSIKISLNDPTAIASNLIPAVIYGDAPYGVVSGGTPESLEAISREDLISFRESYWRPDLATIIVVGGISAEQAQSIANDAFGDWMASGDKPEIPEELAGPHLPSRTIVVDLPGAGQAVVYAVARGIARDDEHHAALQLANSVLGGSATARLFEEIRVKRALSYGSYSQISTRRDEGYFLASAQTKNESAAAVAEVILNEVARIGSEPLDPTLLDDRRAYLKGSFQRSVEQSAGLGGQIATGLLQGLRPEQVLAYPEQIDAADGAQAVSSIGELLAADKMSLIVVGDAKMFIDDLRALRGDVEVIPADELDLSSATSKN